MADPYQVSDVLHGRTVAVSVSDSPDLGPLGLVEGHLRLALGEIARAVFVAGGDLAYGGHLEPQGYTPFLLDELARWERPRPDETADDADDDHDDDEEDEEDEDEEDDDEDEDEDEDEDAADGYSSGPHLLLCLAWTVQRGTPRSRIVDYNNMLNVHGRVVCLTPGGEEDQSWSDGRGEEPAGTSSREESSQALTGMRTWMTRNTSGRVLLGGKRAHFQGRYPGLVEEAILALEAGQPLYLAGGFGGVTLDVVEALGTRVELPVRAWSEDETPAEGLVAGIRRIRDVVGGRGWGALNNGLTDDENAQLATTHRPTEIAALISRGMRAMPPGAAAARREST